MDTRRMNDDEVWQRARDAAFPAMVAGCLVSIVATLWLGAIAGTAALLLVPVLGLVAMSAVERFASRPPAGH